MQPGMNYTSLGKSDRTEETPVSISTSHLISGSRPTRIRQHFTVLLISVLALVGIGLIRFATNAGVASVARQQSNIEAVIDEYMAAMAAGDVQRAYALFSPRAKRQMTVTDIEQLMRGDAYMAFQGYQSVIVEGHLVRTVIDTNSNSPQGVVAQITGAIQYEDGTEGSLAAILERNAGQWRLFNIRVTPSPKRLQRSPQAMGAAHRAAVSTSDCASAHTCSVIYWLTTRKTT